MENKRLTYNQVLVILVIALFIIALVSLFFGRYPSPYWMPPELLFTDTMAQKLVLSLRLPRMLMSMFLGMALAACGEVLQMIFRNPIVEPGFLGVSQGAAFGAAFAILFLGGSAISVELFAAGFGLL